MNTLRQSVATLDIPPTWGVVMLVTLQVERNKNKVKLGKATKVHVYV